MSIFKKYGSARPLLVAVVLLGAFEILLGGCECRKEGPVRAPVSGLPEPGPTSPVTLQPLQLMPETATIAVGVPPPAALVDKAVNLAKRIAGDQVDVDAEVGKMIEGLAERLGSPGAKTLSEILREKGIDPGKPWAVFIDAAPLIPYAKELGAALNNTAGGPPSSSEQSTLQAVLMRAAVVVVIPCIDNDSAANLAKTIEEEWGISDTYQTNNIEAGDIEITFYVGTGDNPSLGHFLVGNWLVAGNDADFLKAAAQCVGDPAAFRYGTPDCPASELDELVEFVRIDQMMPLMAELLSGMTSSNPLFASMAAAQKTAMDQTVAAFQDPDPMVVTVAWTPERIEMLSRLDIERHVRVLEWSGAAAPLRQAVLLPETTSAFVALRITPEAKKQFETQWLGSIPPEMQNDPGVLESMGVAKVITSMIGEEITFGIHGTRSGYPLFTAMVALTNPDALQGLLTMWGIAGQAAETYKDIEIMQMEGFSGFGETLSFGFPPGMVIVSNDLPNLKSILDLLGENTVSPLFESMAPPLDPNLPRYGAVVIRDTLIGDIRVLSGFDSAGMEPSPEATAEGVADISRTLDRIRNVIDSVRLLNEIDGKWLSSRVAVYFK